ncbi:hypothetical protein [Sphingomonas sp. S2M10]|uniref:hypothetical protein n=1 Tax=Sphingomonas sp. S2M10 TaxID=2705010 RepID=UPI00145668F1|nr:hypothetical protein [Sphingomonas sp. S2M10]
MRIKDQQRRPRTRRIEIRHPDKRIPSYLDANEPASRSRVRRPVKRWEGLEEASKLAQVVVLRHGGHARPVINRGQRHLRSRMSSRKTGLQQVIEGRGHRDFAMWNEVNPHVIDFEAHPFHFIVHVNGKRVAYYPDHVRLLRDGTIELIEVKRTPADLDDEDYRQKLGVVAEVARRCGWVFRILYHADITGPKWRMRNVEAIYSRRYMIVTREEQDAISQFVARGAPATWAALRDAVAPDDTRRGNAVLENAVALGRIGIELDDRITDDTEVTPLPPVAHRNQIRL